MSRTSSMASYTAPTHIPDRGYDAFYQRGRILFGRWVWKFKTIHRAQWFSELHDANVLNPSSNPDDVTSLCASGAVFMTKRHIYRVRKG